MSIAAGIVAANLPPAKRGENIVVPANEFSSNFFPWLLLRDRGYEVRPVPSTEHGTSADAFGEVADEGTRLIAVSAVASVRAGRIRLSVHFYNRGMRLVCSRAVARPSMGKILRQKPDGETVPAPLASSQPVLRDS